MILPIANGKTMAAPLSALLRAVILAACVAGAIAGAPSEEWAERLRLLETRVEQSEQREAEQLRRFETGVEQSKQREAALNKRVAFLEGEVQRLRPATAPKVRTDKAAVGSMGEPQAVGRRLDHEQPSPPPPSPPLASPPPTCCRWTADGTCGTVPAERFEVCTHMHEYLETKTTTHEFDDLDACLGPDASKWSAKFDGANSNVTLSYDAVAKATLKTPLKVTHAADCGNDPPTLTVQMDTVHDGSLTLDGGSLTLGGNEVHSAPKLLFRYDFPGAATSGDHTFAASNVWRDFPDLTHTPILTKTHTILLVHYQISYNMGVGTDTGTYLCCRLMVDGTEETSARSIDGAGIYGTSSGTWIGEIFGAGSPVIKVQCRNSDALNLYSDYMTKALSVAIIG